MMALHGSSHPFPTLVGDGSYLDPCLGHDGIDWQPVSIPRSGWIVLRPASATLRPFRNSVSIPRSGWIVLRPNGTALDHGCVGIFQSLFRDVSYSYLHALGHPVWDDHFSLPLSELR